MEVQTRGACGTLFKALRKTDIFVLFFPEKKEGTIKRIRTHPLFLYLRR